MSNLLSLLSGVEADSCGTIEDGDADSNATRTDIGAISIRRRLDICLMSIRIGVRYQGIYLRYISLWEIFKVFNSFIVIKACNTQL